MITLDAATQAPPRPPTCTQAEIAAALRVSPSTVYRAVRDGDIPSILVRSVRRVPRDWLDQATTWPPPPVTAGSAR